MAVPTHFKLSFRGVFVGTPEIWNFGVKFSRTVGTGPDAGVSDISTSGVTSAITAFMHDSGAPWSDKVQLTEWRAYQIGTDGRMQGLPKIVDVTTSNIKGLSTNVYPPQVALCVTLVGAARGPGRFGRFYMPGPTAAMAADMRLGVGGANAYATSAVTFLKAVSSAIDLPGTIASSSCVNISPGGGSAGTLQQVDHVEVGRTLDTLRSRRNGMLEDRVALGHIDW